MNLNFSNNELPGFGHGLLVILISALISLVIGSIGMLVLKFAPAFQPWNMLFSFVLTFGITLYAAMVIWRNRTIEVNNVTILLYLLLIPATIGMSILSESIISLIPMPDVVAEFFAKMVQLDLPGYLTVGIAAPILEELIFRGVILKGFLKKYKPATAIVFSSLLFGIAHLNPWQFIGAFIAGLALGWIYYKTKSIWPAIFIHFVNNSFSFLVGYKYNDINTSFYEISGGFINYFLLITGSLVMCYLAYLKINSMTFNNSATETTNNE